MNEDNKEEAVRYLTRFTEVAPGDPDAVTATELIAFLKSS